MMSSINRNDSAAVSSVFRQKTIIRLETLVPEVPTMQCDNSVIGSKMDLKMVGLHHRLLINDSTSSIFKFFTHKPVCTMFSESVKNRRKESPPRPQDPDPRLSQQPRAADLKQQH